MSYPNPNPSEMLTPHQMVTTKTSITYRTIVCTVVIAYTGILGVYCMVSLIDLLLFV